MKRTMIKVIINVVMLLMFSAGIAIQAEGAQNAAPIWMTEPRFQNQNRIEGRPISNGIMAESFRHLFRVYARHSEAHFAGFEALRTMERAQFNPRMNNAARHAMHVGLNDSFFNHVRPNREFLRAVSNTTYTKLAQYTRNTGHLVVFREYNKMFVASNQEEEFFVHLMMDELGSAYFGFNEAMAAFFAERGRGIAYSQHGPNIEEVISTYHARGITGQNRILAGGGSLAYDTNFERVLENVLDQQGRAHELWDAAMTSHEANRNLWDTTPEVASLIGFDDLQMVRGVSLAMGRGFRSQPELRAAFKQAASMTYEEFAVIFARHWHILTGAWHPEFEIRGSHQISDQQSALALQRFQALTQFMVTFGIQHEIPPDISVAEGVMEFYRLRYKNGIFDRALR